jgi:uncharacterized protein (TIGR03000 family)
MMYRKLTALVGLLAALAIAGSAAAGRPGPGEPSDWPPPWTKPAYHGYSEPARPPLAPPAFISAAPSKYTLESRTVPGYMPAAGADRVELMGHVPADALVWIEDAPTTSTGEERHYLSPPMEAGKEFHYSVRVAWVEDGKWVAKESKIDVKAGEEHCFFLKEATPPAADEAKINANLAKLGDDDRKLAEAQKFCAAESDVRLGEVGVPAKIEVKGQPVFICCKMCEKEAKADPEKTLATVNKLKAKSAKPNE